MVDVSDPSVRSLYDAVRSDSDETNWAVFSYVPGQQKIQSCGSGNGGYAEAVGKFADDQVMYAFIRYHWAERNRTKFVFLTWIGNGVKPLQRARISHHKIAVSECFKGFHVEIQGDTKSDFAEDVLIRKLRAAGGADYDGGGRTTGAEFSTFRTKAAATFEKPASPTTVTAAPVAAPAAVKQPEQPKPQPVAEPVHREPTPEPAPAVVAEPEPVAVAEPAPQPCPDSQEEETVAQASEAHETAAAVEEPAPVPVAAPVAAADDEWA